MSTLLSLKDLNPIAKGNLRLVFEHPENSNLLIKVMRPEAVKDRYHEGSPWYKQLRRYRHYVLFVREIQEYIAAYASYGKSLPFAQHVVGFVQTDYGLGLISTAIRDRNGGLAPTLATLIDTGRYDARVRSAVEFFLTQLLKSDLVVADLHERNLVYDDSSGDDPRFIMIDGIGSSTILPLKSISRTFNNWSRKKRVKRLRRRIAIRQERAAAAIPQTVQ